MNLKKIFIYCFIIVIITAVGFLFSLYGSVQYEDNIVNGIIIVFGRILLWPYNIWSIIQKELYPDLNYFSYFAFSISQIIGYSAMFYFLDKLFTKFKKRKRS